MPGGTEIAHPRSVSTLEDVWDFRYFSTDHGFVESFNGRLRDECLNEHLFANLKEAREIIEEWRTDYNTNRPHTSLNGLTPTEFAARPNQGQNWNRLSL